MAGFVFQAKVAISKAVERLLDSAEFGRAGEVFVKALSDVAVRERGGSVLLLQVKRTLTAAALDNAAAEIAAIEAVDAAQAETLMPCYSVVCQHHDIDLDGPCCPRRRAARCIGATPAPGQSAAATPATAQPALASLGCALGATQ